MALAGQVEDRQRIVTEEITVASDGANIEAYLAKPRAAGRHPGGLAALLGLHGGADADRQVAQFQRFV